MRKRTPLSLLALLAGLLAVAAGAETRYVKVSGSKAASGISWDEATNDLQKAIDDLAALGGGEVWVAAGVYIPATGTDWFALDPSVSLYGGFPPNPTTGAADCDELSDRRPDDYPTILSGDRNGDDETDSETSLPTTSSMVDNAARVLDIVEMTEGTTIVDGFFIEGGNATKAAGQEYNAQCGGGIRALAGSGYRQTPQLVVNNCVFLGNRAGVGQYTGGHGGGLYVEQVDVTVSRCSFLGNAAGDGSAGADGAKDATGTPGDNGAPGGNGGGMAVQYGTSVTVERTLFESNCAGSGGNGGRGGVSTNDTGGQGGNGAVGGSGGGLHVEMASTSISVADCTFAHNQAGTGGNGGDGGNTELGGASGGNGGTANACNPNSYSISGCGGGLAVSYGYAQSAAIRGCTFVGNASGEAGTGGLAGTGTGDPAQPGTVFGTGGQGGGIFLYRAAMTIENTTVSGNKAAGNGGGIGIADDGGGQLAGTHLTVFANRTDLQGGGLALDSTSEMSATHVHVRNSVFWANEATGTGNRADDSQVYARHTGVTVTNSVLAEAPTVVACDACVPSDPQLKALSWNGGSTPTLAPQPGSPIVDATFLDETAIPATDQRGFPRDDGHADAGAFELRTQASGVTATGVSDHVATLTWAPGIWGYSVVFVRPDDPDDPKPRPKDGTFYNHSPAYGSGGYIAGTPWCCVYSGSGSTVGMDGLAPGTTYSVMVCDTLENNALFIHNTEDALGNPLVFSTSGGLAPATLVSPIHCPDVGIQGPEEDDPAYGHSLIEEPVFVWLPPAGTDGAHCQVWLDDYKIGDTAIEPAGFRCFDGTAWSDFPTTGMPTGTQRLAFLRMQGGGMGQRPSAQARNWFVRTVAGGQATSDSEIWRFVVKDVDWEDGVPVAGYTLIRKAQMDQMRAEVHALQRMRGLAVTAFSDADIAKNETPVRAAHFQELRQAIRQVAEAIGEDVSSWAWTDATIVPNQTVIRAIHLQELRDALLGTYPVPPGRGR